MKAQMEGSGIKSTMKPKRKKPRAAIIAPAMTDKALPISGAEYSGCSFLALSTIVPTRVDITATGFKEQTG